MRERERERERAQTDRQTDRGIRTHSDKLRSTVDRSTVQTSAGAERWAAPSSWHSWRLRSMYISSLVDKICLFDVAWIKIIQVSKWSMNGGRKEKYWRHRSGYYVGDWESCYPSPEERVRGDKVIFVPFLLHFLSLLRGHLLGNDRFIINVHKRLYFKTGIPSLSISPDPSKKRKMLIKAVFCRRFVMSFENILWKYNIKYVWTWCSCMNVLIGTNPAQYSFYPLYKFPVCCLKFQRFHACMTSYIKHFKVLLSEKCCLT